VVAFGDQMEANGLGLSERALAAKKYQRKVRSAIARAVRVLKDALAGARAIGVDTDALPAAVAMSRANAIRSAAHIRANAYVAAVARLEAGPMKEAAGIDGVVPAYAVADALEDEG